MRSRIATFVLVFAVAALAVLAGRPALAQAIPPGVSALSPQPSVTTGLSLLRPGTSGVIAYVHRPSALAPDVVTPRPEDRLIETVQAWEYVLLGLGKPYRVISDDELAAGIPEGVPVLVLPGSERLSDAQLASVADFVRRGGGLIAQGRIGLFTEIGIPRNPAFFRDLFGAEYVTDLPEQPGGIFQSFDAGYSLTAGLDPGYLLNLVAQVPTTAARPVTSQAVGRLLPYNTLDPDPFRNVTMALYGTSGAGRFFWTRFIPQDVSRDTEQQRNYVTVLINALAYVSNSPVAGLRAWPNGKLAAASVAMLPLPGARLEYRRTTNELMTALARVNAPATFFATADEARVFPDVMQRFVQAGELAYAGRDDGVLKNEPLRTQLDAVLSGLGDLRRFDPNVSGFQAPAGYFDHNTLRAMEAAGLTYMLRFLPHPSSAPSNLPLAVDSDYRETRYGYLLDEDTLNVINITGNSLPSVTTGTPSTDLRVPVTVEGINPPSVDTYGRYLPMAPQTDAYGRTIAVDAGGRVVVTDPNAPVYTAPPSPGVDLGQGGRRRRFNTSAPPAPVVNPPGSPTRTFEGPEVVVNGRLLRPGDPGYYNPLDNNRAVRPRTEGRPDSAYARFLAARTGVVGDRTYQGWHNPFSQLWAVAARGRDDYAITANYERSGRPDLQLAAYRSDFLDVLDAHGLYIMPLHADVQGSTEDRANVVAEMVEMMRGEGTWVATLRDIRAWWQRRSLVTLRLVNVTTAGADLEVENTGEALEGVGVDLFLGEAGRTIRASGADVVQPEDNSRTTVVFSTLPSGISRVRLTFGAPAGLTVGAPGTGLAGYRVDAAGTNEAVDKTETTDKVSEPVPPPTERPKAAPRGSIRSTLQ